MGELTVNDCEQDREETLKYRVVALLPRALPEHHPGQLFFCMGLQGTESRRASIAYLVSLSTGEAWKCWQRDIIGELKPELLGEKERLQLSQIRPFGALDVREQDPEYSGYSFLPDGRYAAGVWLAGPEEAWEYVRMQKDYQYRVMICDRDDFAVLEIQEGKLLFPDEETIRRLRNEQGGQGMEMR